MGYTHYWRGAANITEDAVADINKIIAESGVSIVGGFGDSGTAPEVSTREVYLNGEEDDSHETFQVFADGTGFNFCKTASKPYDAVVGAILLRIKDDSPAFEISSDGYWEEWEPARDLYQKVTGKMADQPWEDD